jgi:Permuted papain-like amidase enzyme, YaeF/YiiX, C92 family
MSGQTLPPDPQLEADAAMLREVFAGFERLEVMYEEARQIMSPRQRGFYTPDEDNQIRAMLLAYRNYRLACWDVIWRYKDFSRRRTTAWDLRRFIVGYAAALRLFQKSLRLVEIAEFDPMLRRKLNEPDRKYDLESGFFEDVLISYSSVYNYLRMVAAGMFWRSHRRLVRELGLEEDPVVGWLVPVITRERRVLQGKFWQILGKRLRRDWGAAWRLFLRPARMLRHQSLTGFARIMANLEDHSKYKRGIGNRALAHVGGMVQPGDVLLIRTEDSITAALLPGFWTHACIYAGTVRDLERLGLLGHPKVSRLHEVFARQGPHALVIEAVPRGCRVHTLEYALRADDVMVLRPNVEDHLIRDSLLEAFSHVGKPYDFEFDFNVSTRIVCTELVYRSLHGRGPISFQLTRRLGRFCLSPDDIVEQQLAAMQRGDAPFSIVELMLRDGGREAVQVDEALRSARLARLSEERPALL